MNEDSGATAPSPSVEIAVVSPDRWSRTIPPLLLASAVVVFTVLWTWIGWLQYQTLHLTVYDFGLIYQEIWATAHGQSLLRLGPGAVHPLILAFVPTLGLFPSASAFFLFLLTANSAALALGAIPLYLLARDAYRNPWLASGLAVAYLAFPAVAGSVWFPAHLESFFPVLFLTGYWLYRRNLWGWAAVAWTVAMVTNIGAPVIIGAFAVGMFLEPLLAGTGWWDHFRGRPMSTPTPFPRRRLWLIAYLLIASAVVFLGIALALIAYDGAQGFVNFLLLSNGFTVHSSAVGAGPLSPAILGKKALTFLLLFGPLLGLPFLGREERWAMLPFLGHAFIVGAPELFLWPFKDQYFCYILPGLFASTLRGLERPWWHLRSRNSAATIDGSPPNSRRRGLRNPAVRWGTAAIVAVLLVGLVFAPWGPANPALGSVYGLAQGSYNFSAVTTADGEGVQAVQSLIAITPSQGNLLVQNNLVQPLDRFHYVVPGYQTSAQPVSYVLTDPYNPTFYDPNLFGPYPASMLRWANYYLANGASALGEADGALLLSVNDTGPTKVYEPLQQSFGPSAFPCCGTRAASNVTGPTPLASGPALPIAENYSAWSPGNFTVTVAISLNQPAPTNQLSVALFSGPGLTPLANFTVIGSSASPAGMLTAALDLHVPVYLPEMHVEITALEWSGRVAFEGLWVNQTAPVAIEHLGSPWSNPPQSSVSVTSVLSGFKEPVGIAVPWLLVPLGGGVPMAGAWFGFTYRRQGK